MLLIPHGSRPSLLEDSVTNTSSEGITVTASATPHTKGAWTQLIASSSFDSYGIWVMLNNVGGSSTATAVLVDIGIGAASSETVLIPNLDAGNAQQWVNGFFGQCYFFPLRIPSGTRISARCQAVTASDTVAANVWLMGGPRVAGCWTGTRVTAYGADTGTSSGTALTPGASNTYGTAAQLTASTTAPIRYMQVAMSLGTDATGANTRQMLRLGTGATPDYFISDLPMGESTTAESAHTMAANWILSQMHFNIPEGTEIRGSLMSTSAEARNFIIYGVD